MGNLRVFIVNLLCDMNFKMSVENSFPKIARSSGYIRRMTYQVAS